MNYLPKKKNIIKELKLCSNSEEKLIYIIDLGKFLPFKKKNIRKKKYIIYGCQNNTWIKIKKKKKIFKLNGDSNTLIIKGLLLIIILFLNNKKKKKILNINIYKILKKLNIIKYITYNRLLGINLIFDYIKKKLKKNF